MLRAPSLLLLALTIAVPAVAVPRDASAETKKQKKTREKKEAEDKEKADAEAAAAAEAQAAADAEAAEKAAAEAAAAPPEPAPEPAPVVEVSTEGATAGSWSMSIIDRPLNLLKGMIRVDADLGILKINIPAIPPATSGSSLTGVALGVGAGYGISDKLEAGVSYAISLKEFEAKGPLSLYGLFNLVHSDKMRISAGASFGYNLASEKIGIGAGLAFQYHLAPKMMVFMTPTHLSIGLDPTVAAINLPVGFGFQATPNIFAYAETNLFDIGLKPSGSAFIFADRTPLTVGGSYSPSNKMDLGASINASNLPDIADLFVITVYARLYFGSVPTSGAAAATVVTDPTTDAPPAE